MAFADDELDARLAIRVRHAVDNDDDIRAKLEVFLSTRTLLSRAFDAVLREPIPDRLEQIVRSGVKRRRNRRAKP
ncbi:MAG: hypothetical protein AB7S70_07195 [Hyphomicrobium sp.]|uniref:hypothetical protein n=1 Tax=Hyphomicrobium sp. TaxID=82 RepID=UPI003D14513A